MQLRRPPDGNRLIRSTGFAASCAGVSAETAAGHASAPFGLTRISCLVRLQLISRHCFHISVCSQTRIRILSPSPAAKGTAHRQPICSRQCAAHPASRQRSGAFAWDQEPAPVRYRASTAQSVGFLRSRAEVASRRHLTSFAALPSSAGEFRAAARCCAKKARLKIGVV